jgi:hypothetical protein
MALTRRQKYERKSVADLRFYAAALGIHPVDVHHYLMKRVSVYELTKADLIELHMRMDRAGRGLGSNLS